MHIAQVYFWGCIGPVSRVFKFKTHLFHICCYLLVANRLTINERLLNDNFEFSTLIAAKT